MQKNALVPLLWLSILSPIAGFSLGSQRRQQQQQLVSARDFQSPTSLSLAVHSSNNSGSTTFPVSVRAELLKKAKELDRNLADGKSLGSYSPNGWSNRVGLALTPAALPGVYTGDRPFYWNRIDVGCRMCVIQLENSNDLWVHSPVGLDSATKNALNKLGTVKYVVSPNYEHLKFAEQWYKEYPDAFMWGCPGLAEKLPNIEWEGEIPTGLLRPTREDQKQNCWNFNEIVPLHLDMEVNPFTGKPFFNEVIFFHRPSKTLMTTDLFWNYPQPEGVPNSHLNDSGEWELAPSVSSVPIGSLLWKQGMDKVYLPFYKNFMVNNRSYYDEVKKIILDEWNVETLIPAHGDIIRGKEVIREVLSRHLS
ncbi:protein of unknown function DUF4336 containing protein [Nitzschia inconspicua]|uniref:Metallo-beta-lactamase domain-containing protein n=1 Tax=Nitzschia inconspicua TaxID=303405 RepID=A0A9K3LGH9_9STRA|nr:protein of unknown function DUF4336 containing protein [Nitzschia inconspicua]